MLYHATLVVPCNTLCTMQHSLYHATLVVPCNTLDLPLLPPMLRICPPALLGAPDLSPSQDPGSGAPNALVPSPPPTSFGALCLFPSPDSGSGAPAPMLWICLRHRTQPDSAMLPCCCVRAAALPRLCAAALP
eukprot:364387-Chlamydomonas_euryale.AAC.1